jgi:F0F1-type ATP synthase assembly protein I
MSLIATIALSRKTGTQGFITVEDFFGGFVVGALIGYGGSAYFERAIIPPTPNPSAAQ